MENKKNKTDTNLNNLYHMEDQSKETKSVHIDDLDCPYCIEFIYRKPKPILNTIGYPYQDRILYENEHALVVPTIGSIVPNYLLIIPKRHVISCNDLSSEEIESLIQCKKKIEHNVGNGTIFEHGSLSREKSGGASIEHAHLHFIPVEIDHSIISNKLDFKKINSIAEINSVDSEYLLIWNKKGIYYAKSDSVPSQFLRKVIAEYFGVPDKWNWKEFPFVENMQHTYTSWKKFE
jgi:diadenosine tetraphosphate (Ap4A) HIT family hydrolase